MKWIVLSLSVFASIPIVYAGNCPEEVPACPRFIEQLKKLGRSGLERAVNTESGFQVTLTVDRVGPTKSLTVQKFVASPSDVFSVESYGYSGRTFQLNIHPAALLARMPSVGDDDEEQKILDDRAIERLIDFDIVFGPSEEPAYQIKPQFHAQFGVAETFAQATTDGILARERTIFPALFLAVELENQPRMTLRAEVVGAMREQGGVSVPYADLRYTPYFFDVKDSARGGVNFTPLSGSITRNVYTGNAFQGRVYLLGFEGRAVHHFSENVQFYFEAAVKGLGVRLQQWILAPYIQGSVGAVEARADLGLAIRPTQSFMVKLVGGAFSALSIFPGSADYGVALENDTRAYGQLTIEIARLIELFARGSVDFTPTTQGANFSRTVAPTVRLIGGVGVVF